MPDEMKLLSMAELKSLIEQTHGNSPQRLQLARTYMESLTWGLKGLEGMGQKLAFTVLPPPAPQEFPKMVYKRKQVKIAANATEETLLQDQGFFARRPEPIPEPESETATPPVFSVTLGGRHGN